MVFGRALCSLVPIYLGFSGLYSVLVKLQAGENHTIKPISLSLSHTHACTCTHTSVHLPMYMCAHAYKHTLPTPLHFHPNCIWHTAPGFAAKWSPVRTLKEFTWPPTSHKSPTAKVPARTLGLTGSCAAGSLWEVEQGLVACCASVSLPVNLDNHDRS